MSQPVITVENLSKAYRLGLKEEVPDTMTAAVKGVMRAPLRNLNQLRRLSTTQVAQDDAEEDTLWALKDVSFEVNQGDVVGIIGRNGAGKSTLLKILSRITEPTSGRAVIRGRISSLLEVGTGFHPELSGRDNIYMNGTILGMSKKEIDRKFDEIVDFSGVEKFLDTPTKRYSSGMQVRLAFAVAAHLEPEILVIDEVLAVGDFEFQKKCLGKMKDVATGGRTVLFVSHNMAAIQSLCVNGVGLSDGQVASVGPIREVIDHYQNSVALCETHEEQLPFVGNRHLISATILDKINIPTHALTLGSEFRLRIAIQTSHELLRPKVGLGIDDTFGQRMLTVHTPISDESLATVQGLNILECRIPILPLAPGKYVVKLALSEGAREIESVKDCCPFTVLDGDPFAEGRGHHHGLCIAQSTWSCKPQNEANNAN
ncbi:ABC transporter ATP-binding protein [Rhodopirellula sp. SWK7]|uniref:ABC transporter ATP-binding protein n=1 Tax=Rhodopirellula sp. SWK7 TaxID=595460 RepID=UPI0002BFA0C2|nr:ABC transporter ATP-binding protein [Rhodopirellula sp. SWK7]EMI44592.1 polysaccharide ABC transporter, ATP-binding protein [Rhodopirellula sp. SWK7]